ncbi:hypothetical protein Ahy_A07g036125 [Arachis hypogaea]|uniref:Uncharacterized protein n=1 Tax=Arachis hypogaea TaxID=3818 RepID=A0A445CFB5_ARAHY|nr:hypothetical protein Ahy_A07g036125 [Arachis hypogaea]
MSEAKKVIVRDLEFGGLMHIPPINMSHKLLKELANSFNLDKNKLDTKHDSRPIFRKGKNIKEYHRLDDGYRSPNVQEDFRPLYLNGVVVANYRKQSISCPYGSNFLTGQHNEMQLGQPCPQFHHQRHNQLLFEKEKIN